MTILGSIKNEQISKVLRIIGFEMVRQKGSHSLWKHSDGRMVTLPVHKGKNLKIGLLHKIITKDIGITINDFLKIIKD